MDQQNVFWVLSEVMCQRSRLAPEVQRQGRGRAGVTKKRYMHACLDIYDEKTKHDHVRQDGPSRGYSSIQPSLCRVS